MITAAITGRTNVGKSTLFNRLARRKLALVYDEPGLTRDRRMGNAQLGDLNFRIVDTAGLEDIKSGSFGSLSARIQDQTKLAIVESDIILFMIDGRSGLFSLDFKCASMLHKLGKFVILVANKVERAQDEHNIYEACSMGFGDPVTISARHGDGMIDLKNAIDDALNRKNALALKFMNDHKTIENQKNANKPLKITVVGRPNVGKSTLINQIIKEERLLTGPDPGTTRDSIPVDWKWQDRSIKIFDTAGLRKKARVHEKIEKLSVSDSLRSIQHAEVVIIVFDATSPLKKQDIQIVDLVVQEGRAPVIVFNKWDLIKDKKELLSDLHKKTAYVLPQIRGIKTVPLSGKNGIGLQYLMDAIVDIESVWKKRISTSKLIRWLECVQEHHPPPLFSGKRMRFKYITQIKTRPPTFFAQWPHPENLPDSYERYLINELRRSFELHGIPLRLQLRKKDNPYRRTKDLAN
ncbi:ribosome biogenesis GTPase Der [Candidatus Endowatersipora endosymbiont of Watersipora subatra]|uniref:ribosome biogenesis GTPase Der n=1 Tax=Candidatus Endowatersipora endosymbiont of Watersipora subatra TaxID=3077946 RepID=UPI00312C83ED